MYDYIIGKVTRITPEYIVLEQNGIGYRVFTPNPYAFRVDEEIRKVFIHMYIREDAQQLFGFKTLEQRELFRKLIQVSGIGPKSALSILASGNPSQVITAIEMEDESFLVKFPGVGKKTARQMILDLKGRLGSLLEHVELPSAQDELPLFGGNAHRQEMEDAMQALRALGYSEKELAKILPALKERDDLETTESYMKYALKLLLNTK
ncbi:Holliday junction branch migration protein RuvA [Ureibacillus sp. FSL K6-8385]|uniref:Holliday junction branch migration complex subunit RuvA n=2 Tax=Bacillati TaxID=1783272 RepID=A0A540V0A2_9BACL|nr:Holliday junction branch migration protein RuvA [Ureibacillus terrenus]MED3660997.1 Holliday junction branch migration protein RuvA [Ureibacillus terrenus]MED3764886.1 Holliday junction branch migration protein RuvA [Ureibacillus terrenus]TQE90107.1 Holliday junction branch migration protein RuvA [Ureibacillus terrenus]